MRHFNAPSAKSSKPAALAPTAATTPTTASTTTTAPPSPKPAAPTPAPAPAPALAPAPAPAPAPKPALAPAPVSVPAPNIVATQQFVKVYAYDEDTFPLAQFEALTSVQHILITLKLHNGGLKVKGGEDTFIAYDSKLPPRDYVTIGSSGIRIKVVWKGNKLIIPYPFPSHQVQQLMEELSVRFARFNTGASSPLKMAELRTLDGYLINKYDRIMEAIYDGDQLEAIDFDIWVKEQAKLCKDTWLSVSQADFVDEVSKWATVGKHTHGKLFVQLGHGNEIDRLELFEIEDLKVFAKEGQHQILNLKGNKNNFDWYANASFSVNAKGQVTSVILEVKSLSDVRPLIKEIKVTVGNEIVKGDIHTIQTAEEDAKDTVDKLLPTPKKVEVAIVDGPKLPPPTMAAIEAFQKVKIEQVENVFADQNWASGEVFKNFFYINFSFTNPNDTIVTIAKVKTEYEKEGSWVPTETAIGYKQGFYNYRWNWNTTNFSLDKHNVDQVSILASIPITAPQVDRLRRAHYSLPQPLKIRVTFQDDQGDTSSIVVEYHNPPHELPTKEYIEKQNSKTYDFWAQLDDKETESRHYIAIARVQENENKEYLDIKASCSSSTYYFYKPDFQKYAFEAVKQGVDCVEIDTLKSSSNGVEVAAYALVDVATRSVYALKWTLDAHGAHLEDYYRIKPLKYN